MDTLEIISKVRETEEKADRILEEAREWVRAEGVKSRQRRKDLLEDARRRASEELAVLEKTLQNEYHAHLKTLHGETEAEKTRVKKCAALRTDEAASLARELFLEACSKRGK